MPWQISLTNLYYCGKNHVISNEMIFFFLYFTQRINILIEDVKAKKNTADVTTSSNELIQMFLLSMNASTYMLSNIGK